MAAHRVSWVVALALVALSGLARADDAPEDVSVKIHGAEPGEVDAINAANAAPGATRRRLRLHRSFASYPCPRRLPARPFNRRHSHRRRRRRSSFDRRARAGRLHQDGEPVRHLPRDPVQTRVRRHRLRNRWLRRWNHDVMKDVVLIWGSAMAVAGLVMILVGEPAGADQPSAPRIRGAQAQPFTASFIAGPTSGSLLVSF